MNKYGIKPYGDAALILQFEQAIDPQILRDVSAMAECIRNAGIPGVRDLIPAYASLTVCFDPDRISMAALQRRIERLDPAKNKKKTGGQRTVEIPVLYGHPFPEDLAAVAAHAGITEAETVRIHTANTYPVYMIGFLPGFPYLGNLDERIHTPRRKTPRTLIPAGSVGIGGSQTGVYPIASPGGWHIIGMTPAKLYDPREDEPVLLKSGDLVRFRAIDEKEYREIENGGGKLWLSK